VAISVLQKKINRSRQKQHAPGIMSLTYYSPKDRFDKKDLIRVLTELSFPFSKPEIDQWIWEIDEDLDGCIN